MKIYRDDQQGFSLLELLLVLGIVCFLTSLGIILQQHLLKEKTAEQFLTVFQEDIQYLQQLSLTKENVQLQLYDGSYAIRNKFDKRIYVERELPDNYKISLIPARTSITFTTQGVIRNPGTARIITPDQTFVITFPFGKARGYINEG